MVRERVGVVTAEAWTFTFRRETPKLNEPVVLLRSAEVARDPFTLFEGSHSCCAANAVAAMAAVGFQMLNQKSLKWQQLPRRIAVVLLE